MTDTTAHILIALAGGLFPALAWLWFWRREDSAHPEPRMLIALAFFAGMMTVLIVIPIQKGVAPFLASSTVIFTVWSAIEEMCKYIAARVTVLRGRDYDEPIDAVIYMVAVALGFSALENGLFLFSPLAGDTPLQIVQTGDLRFVGATLLHVLSSSVIGMALALSFYATPRAREYAAAFGIILAIVLHSAFNYLILNTPSEDLLHTFALVWISLIGVLAVVEYIKRIHPHVIKYVQSY